jgi:diaminohydroxyphosphoribosylaminopyrimidine deaminase / 5-amino-6-(5-phosphoribosylamino)uracil reductase
LSEHDRYMRRAIELARRGKGMTSPNPAVGAVIVQNGGVAGEGWHEYAGGAHAEVNAIKAAGRAAYGSAMYVTLEPCNTYGKTPPCTQALVEAGVNKVVIGALDPNPSVSGRGVTALRAAGVEVEDGPFKEEITIMNEGYNKHVTSGLPFVTMKTAMSLDGKIATRTGSSRWITSEPARELVHAMRGESDAVMTGIGTVISDNPRLDVRLDNFKGTQPIRIIIDGQGKIPEDALVVSSAKDTLTIVATTDVISLDKSQSLSDAGVEVFMVPRVNGRIDLRKLLRELGTRGLCSIMLEAGAALATAFISEGLVDKYVIFIAPKLIGGDTAPSLMGGPGIDDINQAIKLKFAEYKQVGEDLYVEAYPIS